MGARIMTPLCTTGWLIMALFLGLLLNHAPWMGHLFPPLISPSSLIYPHSLSNTHTHSLSHPLLLPAHTVLLSSHSFSRLLLSSSPSSSLLTNASLHPWEVNFVNGQQRESLSPRGRALSVHQTSGYLWTQPKYGWERGHEVFGQSWGAALGWMHTRNDPDASIKRKAVSFPCLLGSSSYCTPGLLGVMKLIRTQNRGYFCLIRMSLIALCDVSICKSEAATQGSAGLASLSRKTVTHNSTCRAARCSSPLAFFFSVSCSWLRGAGCPLSFDQNTLNTARASDASAWNHSKQDFLPKPCLEIETPQSREGVPWPAPQSVSQWKKSVFSFALERK